MRHTLAYPIVNRHEGAFGTHGFFDRQGQHTRFLEKRPDLGSREFAKRLCVLPRHQQTMTGEQRTIV